MRRPILTWERREPASDVLVVTNMWPTPERPVYGIYVRRQVDSLLRAGVRCDVLHLRAFRSPPVYALGALWFTLSSLRLRGRYRLIHAHAGETGVVARCHLSTPVLVSFCGDDLLGTTDEVGNPTRGSRIRAGFLRQHARLLSGTITKSAVMEHVLPAPVRSRNHVVPNGVDTDRFRPMDRAGARAELGWAPDEPVALFAATKPRMPSKRLWLAEAACAGAAARLGREVRLEIAEDVAPDRVPLLMNAADCLLMTSSVEGSPNTVKEALMCDLPVLATQAGDVDELLAGVEPSGVVAPDPETLATALAAIFARAERSNGSRVAARLADGVIAGRLVSIYRAMGGVGVTMDAPIHADEPAERPPSSR